MSLRLGLMSIERQPAYRAALPPAARLAEAVGLSVALSVPGVLGPTIVRIEHGGYPLHVNLHVGSVMSLDTTATGRVFRAFGDPAQLDAMAASQAGAGATLAGAEQPAPDAGVPQAELDAIRARGIERGVDLPSPGVSAMCVPVFDAQGTLQLALTVIGSTSRSTSTGTARSRRRYATRLFRQPHRSARRTMRLRRRPPRRRPPRACRPH